MKTGENGRERLAFQPPNPIQVPSYRKALYGPEEKLEELQKYSNLVLNGSSFFEIAL